jgi:hypothetical protein
VALKSANLQLSQQERMLQLLQGATTASSKGTPAQQSATNAESTAGTMDMLANFAVQSGMPEQAKEYAQTASTIRKNQSAVEMNEAKLAQQHAQLTSSLLEGVHDQQSFDNALLIYQLETGQKSHYAGTRYTPELKAQIQNTAQTILQSAQTKMDVARGKEADARAAESTARIPLIKAQEAEAEARTKYLDKHGSANSLPTAGDLKAVTDLISSQFNLDDSQAQANARVIARPIAEDAKRMMQDNPALTQSAAVQRAYQSAQNRGDLAGLQPKNVSPGSSADKPLKMPDNLKGLKENQWYTDSRLGPEPRVYMNGQFWTRKELEAQDDEAPAKEVDEDGDE